MAAYCGLKHSGVFGKVLSQSGTFIGAPGQELPTAVWDGEAPGLLMRQFVRIPRLPLDFYIEVGRYETTLPFSMLLETRRLRDVLEAKGYGVTYSKFVGGHSEVCWRGSFANAVMNKRNKEPHSPNRSSAHDPIGFPSIARKRPPTSPRCLLRRRRYRLRRKLLASDRRRAGRMVLERALRRGGRRRGAGLIDTHGRDRRNRRNLNTSTLIAGPPYH